MQLERLQSMDWQINDNRKTFASQNATGIDEKADSDEGSAGDQDDLNDRKSDESTDPIEEFLRDFTAADEDEISFEQDDDDYHINRRPVEESKTSRQAIEASTTSAMAPPALSQIPSKITEHSSELLDNTFHDRSQCQNTRQKD